MTSGDISPTSEIVTSRKRSKVSRACDACRRKKVRCDGEFSSSSNVVTKKCTNCTKNTETCTFSRVPLKRGPSKGYIRDLEEKLEHTTRPRKLLSAAANPSNPSLQSTTDNKEGLPTQLQPLPYPGSHPPAPAPKHVSVHASTHPPSSTSQPQPPNLTSSLGNNAKNQQSSSPIILPPLIGNFLQVLPSFRNGTKDVKTSNSSPSSPHNNGQLNALLNHPLQIKNKSPPIQGPFWKVPYEMPSNNHNRRSSVDSISSSNSSISGVSNVSRSRLPSLRPSVSASDTGVSDSEDDFYSSLSQSLSPRNSISSLSSLNGRINSSLGIGQLQPPAPIQGGLQQQQQQQIQSVQQQQQQHILVQPRAQVPYGQYQPQQQQVGKSNYAFIPMHSGAVDPTGHFIQQSHFPPSGGSYVQPPSSFAVQGPKFPVHTIEQNISMYYAKFHDNFPILPFNENLLKSMVDSMVADVQFRYVLDLFHLALSSINNYKTQNIKDNIDILNRALTIYPFANHGILPNDNVLVFFFSSLALINYAILLNGDIYSLGLSITVSILNDFKTLEKFVSWIRLSPALTDPDNITVFLPKIYHCLCVIDSIYSLAFGVQKAIPLSQMVIILNKNVDKLVPKVQDGCSLMNGITNLKLGTTLGKLVSLRDSKRCGETYLSSFPHESIGQASFPSHFIHVVNDKHEVLGYLEEISSFLQKSKNEKCKEDIEEILRDHQLKLGRLVKRLSLSIINLANYISTINNPHSNSSNNMMIIQNGNRQNVNNFELISPLLNVSYGQSYKLIKLSKLIIDSLTKTSNDSELNNRCLKINNDLSIAFNLLNSDLNSTYVTIPNDSNSHHHVLGSTAIVLIKNKIDQYDLNFGHLSPDSTGNMNYGIDSWQYEYSNSIMKFIEKEDIEGWF